VPKEGTDKNKKKKDPDTSSTTGTSGKPKSKATMDLDILAEFLADDSIRGQEAIEAFKKCKVTSLDDLAAALEDSASKHK
jgi:hypothetical protein